MIELLLIVLLLLGAVGTGRELLYRWQMPLTNHLERLVFAAGLGYGVLILVMLSLGLVGLLQPLMVRGVAGVWIVFGCYRLWACGAGRNALTSWRTTKEPWLLILAALTLAGILLGGLKAAAPPHGATDPLAYQLALPKIFLQKGFLSFEATITGALYPDNMNLLYAVGLAMRNGALAQLIHWSMGVLCAVGLVGFCERYLTRSAGLWAAAIFATMPLVVVFGTQGYIDVGLCFFQFLAFWALANWMQTPTSRALVLAAVCTGLAMGTKHQGLATLAVGVPTVIIASLRAGVSWTSLTRRVLLYGGVAIGLALPWYGRALIVAGNPIWPLANGLFGGLPFGSAPVILSGAPDASLLDALLPPVDWWTNYWPSMSPWSWAFLKGGWQKATGIYFVALVPAALLLGWREPRVRWLLGFCLLYYGIVVRMLHMNPRYGLVLFVFAAAVSGWAAQYFSQRCWRPAALLFRGVFLASMFLNVAWQYYLFAPLSDVVLGRESWEQFLRRTEYNYAVFEFANTRLPPGSRVLLQGMVRGLYCDTPYMWDHPNQAVLRYADYPTPESLLVRLQELQITHIARVIQVSPTRQALGYPQYFADPFHEEFRRRYLHLLYRDPACVLFEINAGGGS